MSESSIGPKMPPAQRHRRSRGSAAQQTAPAVALVFLLAVSSSIVGLASGDEDGGRASCSFDAESQRLWCSLRTLNANNQNSSFVAVAASANRASRMTVQCSDVFFYESILRTNHFGYLPNLRKLDLDYCKIRRVPALAFSGLSGLRELDVRTHNSDWSAMVLEIEQDAFTGLNDLRVLNFTHNNIWSLPEGAFCGLNSLTLLNLSVNFLQDASELGFGSSGRCGKIPLETLDLSRNSIVRLPSGAFSQLPKLRELRLEGNGLNALDDGALSGLPSLQTLSLSDNRLVALPPDLFSSSGLQELYLQNNSLSVLAPGIFQGLDRLLVLNLSRNEISDEWLIAPPTLTSLARLVALDLSHNRINRLDQGMLSGLMSLQVLNLQHNRIKAVAPDAFLNQNNNLHILLLSHNDLEALHPKSLSGLTVLRSLSLDHNRLSSLHRNALKNCSGLQDLALNNNRFDDVPKALRSLSMLRTLDLGENQIGAIRNESFSGGLDNLYGLRLAGNGLRRVDPEAFKELRTLQVLNLAHNRLEKLDHAVFNPLTELQMLRLDNNMLEDINGLLTTQGELRWLNISANRIQWFDFAFIPKNLKWLDLHENEVEDLGNYYKLSSGFGLTTLDASNNKIKSLGPLSLPSSLEYVFLNGNRISNVEPNTFLEKPDLVRVELTSNHLERLELSSLAISPKAKGK